MLRAIGDKVIIEVVEKQDEVTEGGIVIPIMAQKDGIMHKGIVTSVGEGKMLSDGSRSTIQVRVGDKVMFWQSNDHSMIRMEGKEYYAVKEEAIFVILEETNDNRAAV